MSSKNKHGNTHGNTPKATVVTSDVDETKEPTVAEEQIAETEKVEETPKEQPKKVELTPEQLAAIVSQLPPELQSVVEGYSAITDPELKAKAKANVEKLAGADKEAKDAEKWKPANAETIKRISKVLEDVEKEFGVSFTGRKIVIVDGLRNLEANFTHVIAGAKTAGTTHRGGGTGFASHGKVEYDGKEYGSKHALALAMNWKYEGRRTSAEAIEKPQDMSGKDLGFTNTITEKDGRLIVVKNG